MSIRASLCEKWKRFTKVKNEPISRVRSNIPIQPEEARIAPVSDPPMVVRMAHGTLEKEEEAKEEKRIKDERLMGWRKEERREHERVAAPSARELFLFPNIGPNQTPSRSPRTRI